MSGGITYTLTADTALARIQQQAQELGAAKLGHDPDAIRIHSICSTASTAMILSGMQNYMVMLIGWWKSDVCLTCVRKQVAEFIKFVNQKMITRPTFFHPPENGTERPKPPFHSLLNQQW